MEQRRINPGARSIGHPGESRVPQSVLGFRGMVQPKYGGAFPGFHLILQPMLGFWVVATG